MHSLRLFRSTVPKQSTGIVIATVGFVTMAIGGKYIANALAAGKRAAVQNQFNADGTPIPPTVNHSLRYYDGGFEETMDRREAALILGCRESACLEQIMDRYRHMVRVNHPDLGGSPYLTGKINDAKTMLAGRARSDPEWLKSKKRREERSKRKEAREEQKSNANRGNFDQ